MIAYKSKGKVVEKAFLTGGDEKMNEKLYEQIKKQLVEKNLEDEIWGGICLSKLLFDPNAGEEVIEKLNLVARWFEFPYPKHPGRDVRQGGDFVSHKLIRILYSMEDKLPKETMDLIHRFFTERNFESLWKSENHMFLFHESRYLYALKYPDTYFKQYQKTSKEIIEEDRKFLQEFIRFRAQRGWAEFDAYGYGMEILTVLMNLYDFADEPMSKYAEMSANTVLLDMLMDCSKEGYYGGAHGRIYQTDVFDFRSGAMNVIYELYFGNTCNSKGNCQPEVIASNFRPADYVYDVWKNRPDSWENRECKHLHSITYEKPHKQVPQVPGNINKRTYITPDYMIGGVTWQDDYPEGSPAAWYAHHQQHEWELSFLSAPDLRIFSHHPGSTGPEGKEHGYWTGDLFCCCVQTFSDKNIAMATYDIPENELDFIHAAVPLTKLETEQEGNYLWIKASDRVYAMLWFAQGIFEGGEGDLKEKEVRSYGRKHGVVCTVATKEECGGYEEFKAMVKANKPEFDAETMTLSYANLKMNRHQRFIDGKQVVFPYDTYDSPCVHSKWGSGVIETDKVILDFNGWGTVTYK